MIVYKVLKITNDKLYSACVNGEAKKQYKLRVKNHTPSWLKNQNYFLVAFRYLKHARIFKTDITNSVIYKAEVDQVMKHDLPKRMANCYINKNTNLNRLALADWPIGTIMVDGLKLIKQVK